MRLWAIALCFLFLMTKLLVRPWLYRPAMQRPQGLRSNCTLQTLDFVALLALVAAVFLLFNIGDMRPALWVGVGLLGLDFGLRKLFLHVEVRRLRASSSRRSYSSARKQVQKRSLSDTSY